MAQEINLFYSSKLMIGHMRELHDVLSILQGSGQMDLLREVMSNVGCIFEAHLPDLNDIIKRSNAAEQNEENKKVYMFLMLAWAIISDCDINSEVIRWAGPPRFTLWGVYRVFALRHYEGEFEYTGMECLNNTIPSQQ